MCVIGIPLLRRGHGCLELSEPGRLTKLVGAGAQLLTREPLLGAVTWPVSLGLQAGVEEGVGGLN